MDAHKVILENKATRWGKIGRRLHKGFNPWTRWIRIHKPIKCKGFWAGERSILRWKGLSEDGVGGDTVQQGVVTGQMAKVRSWRAPWLRSKLSKAVGGGLVLAETHSRPSINTHRDYHRNWRVPFLIPGRVKLLQISKSQQTEHQRVCGRRSLVFNLPVLSFSPHPRLKEKLRVRSPQAQAPFSAL